MTTDIRELQQAFDDAELHADTDRHADFAYLTKPESVIRQAEPTQVRVCPHTACIATTDES